jgi:hypothetical protein
MPVGDLPWRGWEVAAVVGALIVLVVFRAHAFPVPLETDECNYAYIGERLLEGDRLYVDVWDHQPFGIFWLCAGVIRVFGSAPEVFRWLAVGFSAASLLLIYGLVRQLSTRSMAAFGAVLFALVSSDPGTAGDGCNREIYMTTFILAAWWFAVRRPQSWWAWLAAGTMLGLGSTLKTILAVPWLFLAIWIMVTAARGSGRQSAAWTAMRSLLWFGVGPAIIWITSGLYFALTNRGAEFVDAVFLFNLSYSDASASLAEKLRSFFEPPEQPFVFQSGRWLWLLGAGATAYLLIRGAVVLGMRWAHGAYEEQGGTRRNEEDSVQGSAADASISPMGDPPDAGRGAILLLVIGAFAAVCLPGHFWPHYYYLLVAPLTVALAVGVGDLIQALVGRWRAWAPPWVWALVVLPFVLAVLPPVAYGQYVHYLDQKPFGITVKRYNSRDFWARAHGEKIASVTDPEDTIFVYGNDVGFYYYSGRRCASRYTMITGLHEGYEGHERRREILLAELRAELPRVIILLFDEPAFPEWVAFLRRYYTEPVGADFHDRRQHEAIMLVLTRKDDPIDTIDWDWHRSTVGGDFVIDPRKAREAARRKQANQ